MNLSILKREILTGFEQQIFEIYSLLKQQPTLEPTALVNSLFDQLVKKVSSADINWKVSNLNTKLLKLMKPGLNIICAKGEACLERHWTKQFLSRPRMDWHHLKEFPYFGNYQSLSAWECRLLFDYLGYKPKKILFVGSGCLPLSAIIMAQQYGIIVDCLEMNEESVGLSTSLINQIGLSRMVKVIHNDFFEITDFGSYDAVLVAALVGTNELEKRSVLWHLKKNLKNGQTFLKRSAAGLKTLLYQEVNPLWLSGFKAVKLFNPENLEVINSVILAKKI